MNRGYVKLWRKIEDSPVFQSEGLLKVFVWCMVKANHKDAWTGIKTGKGVTEVLVPRGSFIYGRDSASLQLGMKPSTIHDRMEKLKKLQICDIQPNSHYSIVSIINWDTYQPEEEKGNRQPNRQPTPNQQATDTNKNVKNDKNNTKTLYSECVLLSEDEYQKLVSKFGEQLTKSAVEILNNYILSSGKKYKSHYHTLLLWPMERAKEKQHGVNNGRGKGNGDVGARVQPPIYDGDKDLPTEEERQRGLQRLAELKKLAGGIG